MTDKVASCAEKRGVSRFVQTNTIRFNERIVKEFKGILKRFLILA